MSDLILNPELCVDCAKCERNCPQNAINMREGIPLFCMHCSPDKAPCLLICPEGAIEALGGAIIINEEVCIGCGKCQEVCPIGAINMDGFGQVHKCDLCYKKENKECVENCPTGALSEDSEEYKNQKQERIATEFNKLRELLK